MGNTTPDLRAIRSYTQYTLQQPITIDNNDILAAVRDLRHAHMSYSALPGGTDVQLSIPARDGSPSCLVRFCRDKEGRITAIGSQYDPLLVASILEPALPPAAFAALRDHAPAHFSLSPSEKDKAVFSEYNAAYKAREAKGNQLWHDAEKLPSPPERSWTLTPQTTRGIRSGEYAFTDAASVRPILSATGAFNELIVATYNPTTKTAGMAYVNASTDIASVQQFLTKARGNAERIDVNVLGSMFNEESLRSDVLTLISQDKALNLRTADFLTRHVANKGALAIDASNGAVQRDAEGNAAYPPLPASERGTQMRPLSPAAEPPPPAPALTSPALTQLLAPLNNLLKDFAAPQLAVEDAPPILGPYRHGVQLPQPKAPRPLVENSR